MEQKINKQEKVKFRDVSIWLKIGAIGGIGIVGYSAIVFILGLVIGLFE